MSKLPGGAVGAAAYAAYKAVTANKQKQTSNSDSKTNTSSGSSGGDTRSYSNGRINTNYNANNSSNSDVVTDTNQQNSSSNVPFGNTNSWLNAIARRTSSNYGTNSRTQLTAGNDPAAQPTEQTLANAVGQKMNIRGLQYFNNLNGSDTSIAPGIYIAGSYNPDGSVRRWSKVGDGWNSQTGSWTWNNPQEGYVAELMNAGAAQPYLGTNYSYPSTAEEYARIYETLTNNPSFGTVDPSYLTAIQNGTTSSYMTELLDSLGIDMNAPEPKESRRSRLSEDEEIAALMNARNSYLDYLSGVGASNPTYTRKVNPYRDGYYSGNYYGYN